MYNAPCATLLHSAERRLLSDIHMVLGIAVLASNALAGGWGAIAWLRRDPSVIFWYLLRVAQATVVVQVLLGLGVLAGGTRAPDSLHVLYGTLPLAVTLVSEGLRIQAAGRVLDEADVDDLERLDRREQVLIAAE